MRLTNTGEVSLIERVGRMMMTTNRPDLVINAEDDAVVMADLGHELLLATADIQVKHIRFLRNAITPRQLGWRALAINLSNIAAMGGRPQFTFVSLAVPTNLELTWVEELYRGLRAAADRFNVALIGGDLVRSPTDIYLNIMVLGRVHREQLLLRSGARPGDQVLVTGYMGDAATGLSLVLNSGLTVAMADRESLLLRYLTPVPRLVEAAIIAKSRQATSMIDVSEGLSNDISRICDRSEVGVRLWGGRLPISGAVRRVAQLTNTSVWKMAVTSNDDYELCFTAPRAVADKLSQVITQETATPVTIIGEIVPASQGRRILLPDGKEMLLEALMKR